MMTSHENKELVRFMYSITDNFFRSLIYSTMLFFWERVARKIYKLHTCHKWIGKVLKRGWSYVALSISSRVNFPTSIKGRIQNVKCLFLYTLPGTHHLAMELSSPIQTLWDDLCAYLFIFRNPRGGGGGVWFASTNPAANQNNCYCSKNKQDCSKNKKIRAKVDSRIYGRWRLLVMGSWHYLALAQFLTNN